MNYLYGMIWFGDGIVYCLLDGCNEVDYIGMLGILLFLISCIVV